MSKTQVIFEILRFLMQSKKYWLAPVIICLLLVGFLLVQAGSSSLSPALYALF